MIKKKGMGNAHMASPRTISIRISESIFKDTDLISTQVFALKNSLSQSLRPIKTY